MKCCKLNFVWSAPLTTIDTYLAGCFLPMSTLQVYSYLSSDMNARWSAHIFYILSKQNTPHAVMKSQPEPLKPAALCEHPHHPHHNVWTTPFPNHRKEGERGVIFTLIKCGVLPLNDGIKLQFVLQLEMVLVTVWYCISRFVFQTSKECHGSFGIHWDPFVLSSRLQVWASLFYCFLFYGYLQITPETEGPEKKRSAHVLYVEDKYIIRCQHLMKKSLSSGFCCIG